jgi:hypothetical protein
MEEIWKDVAHPIFKKFYEVSNLGRLKTKGRSSTRGGENNRYTYWVSPRIVSVRRSKENPHLFCSLYAHNVLLKNKTAYVHKIVAESFIKRPTKEHHQHRRHHYNLPPLIIILIVIHNHARLHDQLLLAVQNNTHPKITTWLVVALGKQCSSPRIIVHHHT